MMNEAEDPLTAAVRPTCSSSSSSALHVYVTADGSPRHVRRRGPIASRGVFT